MSVLLMDKIDLPLLVHLTHCATFLEAESSLIVVSLSASQTGVVEKIPPQPSTIPLIRPHTLQAPSERHL